MSADEVLARLKASRDRLTTIDKSEREMILDHVTYLEALAGELLKSIRRMNPDAVIRAPFRKKPQG